MLTWLTCSKHPHVCFLKKKNWSSFDAKWRGHISMGGWIRHFSEVGVVRVSGGRRTKGEWLETVRANQSTRSQRQWRLAVNTCMFLRGASVCLHCFSFCTEIKIKRCDNKERLQPPLPLVVIESHCSTSTSWHCKQEVRKKRCWAGTRWFFKNLREPEHREHLEKSIYIHLLRSTV